MLNNHIVNSNINHPFDKNQRMSKSGSKPTVARGTMSGDLAKREMMSNPTQLYGTNNM